MVIYSFIACNCAADIAVFLVSKCQIWINRRYRTKPFQNFKAKQGLAFSECSFIINYHFIIQLCIHFRLQNEAWTAFEMWCSKRQATRSWGSMLEVHQRWEALQKVIDQWWYIKDPTNKTWIKHDNIWSMPFFNFNHIWIGLEYFKQKWWRRLHIQISLKQVIGAESK